MTLKEKYVKSSQKKNIDAEFDREAYQKKHVQNEEKAQQQNNDSQQMEEKKPKSRGYKRQVPNHLKDNQEIQQQPKHEKKFNSLKEKFQSQKQEQIQEKSDPPIKENQEQIQEKSSSKRQKYVKSSKREQEKYQDFQQGALNELTQSLFEKVKSNSIECLICVGTISQRQDVWNCRQCFQPFHMKCTKKWIINNNKDNKNLQTVPFQPQVFMWTCPKCCYYYSEGMPNYYCFCGAVKEPDFDQYNLPHSCGNNCKRKQPCRHPCPLPCHPGPCPPCKATKINVPCFCGKNSTSMQCGDIEKQFECPELCNKLLNCKKHTCQQTCHSGACSPCQVKEVVTCHCEKESKTLACNSANFTCEAKCEAMLPCKNHYCQLTCHPGSCGPCKKTPELQQYCPCGKYQYPISVRSERTSCLDAIPLCKDTCRKALPCGEHYCPSECHLDECPPCMKQIPQKCLCKASTQKIKCFRRNEEYRCFKVCGKYKSCQIHRCQNECCPAKSSPDEQGLHLCLKVCNKKLKCGNHECPLFCHLGDCQKCPIFVQNDISCVCGKTVLKGPLPCGTARPECKEPCDRKRPCGHSCGLTCHQDDCPPCREQVSKPCRCGKEIIENIPCYQQDSSCGKLCKAPLSCGHLCDQTCHDGACKAEEKCVQKCLKIKNCEHKCTKECHKGTACPTENCDTNVKVMCQCGNRFSFVSCQVFTASCSNLRIECNEYCKNMLRFGSMFDQNKTYYPAQLVKFARKHFSFVQKLELKIEEMIKEGKGYLDIPILNDEYYKKRNLEILLQQNYRGDFDAYYGVHPPFISLKNSATLILPQIKLTKYLKQIMSGEIKPDILPFDATIRFMHLNKFDTIEDLNYILKDYLGLFYAERQNEKILLLHFWAADHADNAAKRLKKQVGNFTQFVQDTNFKLQQEDKKFQDMNNQIKLTQQDIKKQLTQQKLAQLKNNMPQVQPKSEVEEQNLYKILDDDTEITHQKKQQISQEETEDKEDIQEQEGDEKEEEEQDDDGFIQVIKN